MIEISERFSRERKADMTILIQNGHVVDPLTKRDEVCDVLVADGKIRKVGVSLQDEADRILDASGCYVMSGFIDLHVHFRDPGLTYKETLETGGKAAGQRGSHHRMCDAEYQTGDRLRRKSGRCS